MPDELFSVRHGRARVLSQEDFADLIWKGIDSLRRQGYFDEALARHPGPTGEEQPPRMPHADAEFLRRLKRADIFRNVMPPGKLDLFSSGTPISWEYHPDVLWDTLEFLHNDVVSKKILHDEVTSDPPRLRGATYVASAGQQDFRNTINPDLALYDPPIEMLDNGQIVEKPPDELRPLLDDPIPEHVPAPLRDPLQGAIEQYRRRGASDHDKRSALKHLADVLEPLREEIDEYELTADEKALFQLANKFWIRHNDRLQQRRYDGDVWLDWMFYVYVATARALLSVLDRQRLSESVFGQEPDDNGGLPF